MQIELSKYSFLLKELKRTDNYFNEDTIEKACEVMTEPQYKRCLALMYNKGDVQSFIKELSGYATIGQ